ncbi:tetratricopeptide repeat protein [Rhodovulum sp. DZ06]|uniref:tetratricopeptide repeat protein n=1 Tax=Rhodovulum sp. DZ06 TaxID=3425126 RepID=UPI003D354D59
MHRDWLDNPVTAEGPATARGISDFVEGFVAYETKAVNVLEAAKQDPGNLLANAYTGALHLFLESPEAPALARPWLDKAAAAPGTAREQATLAAITAWADGDIQRAIRVGQEALAKWPTDLALAKFTQYHQFNAGDSPGMLATARMVEDANRDRAHFHGMLAFGLEQCHLLDEAEAAALRAVEIQRKEPWAHHALAHVHLTQGRIAEGRAFLSDMAATWEDLNSFMLSHNWWHMALFMISQGDMDAAMETYDKRCWGLDKTYSQDQVGAVALLARLEMAGADPGGRWEELAGWLAVREGDFVNAFLSLQYLYGLARAGREEAARMLAGFEAKAQEAGPEQEVWAEVALPCARGLVAHAEARWAAAAKDLGLALPRMWETGGSHAQRDLFEQLWIDALVKAGKWPAAQQALERRRAYEPNSVPGNRALSMVYGALGLEKEAAAAALRANV